MFDELEELASESVRAPLQLTHALESFVDRPTAFCTVFASPFMVYDRCFFYIGWYGVVEIVGTNTAGSFTGGDVDLYT